MIEKMIGNNEELRIKGETRSKDLVILNTDKYDKLLTELNNFEFMPIEHSIGSLYTYYKENEEMIDLISLLYS